MPRPATPTISDEYAADAWDAVEQVRELLGLNSEEMGAELGLSGAAYRNWRRRQQMPVESWTLFLNSYAHLLDEPEAGPNESRTLYGPADDFELLKRLGEGNRSLGFRMVLDFFKKHFDRGGE